MNKNTFLIPMVAIGFLAVCACSEGNNKNNGGKIGGIDVTDAIAAAEKRREIDPNASGGNTCLLAYQEKYDQLLTKDIVLTLTGFDESKMEVKYTKIMKPEYHSVNYTFDNQRVRERAGYTMPFKDNVQLGSIKAMSLAQFNDSYRAVTAEEDATVDEVLEDLHDGKVTDPDAQEALGNLEKQGVDKEVAKQATGTLRDAFRKVAEGYRKVEGLGDAAVWNVETQELVVLENGVKFDLQVDTKNTNDENKAAAIELARKLLDACN
ncbi:hypothetical protein [Parapedobacter indicus]|uniref:Lipoprotein n=1 Tax=Parapedobacter indicus TaxID=1477437 RepID=A0A1I3INS8_9SPHI|nr:hypothetical protein [Parapedobacter indicus]PPL02240.1 hypothetical protein CLV26_104165 [Parapedobacter indicus]SFI49638.1 hypothetical protein SAMN05444682_104165 [Parapedobacter indicus]